MSEISKGDNSRIQRERIQRKHKVSLQIIRNLFRGVNGKEISKEYRANLSKSDSSDNPSLTYGEIVPDSFQQILSFVTKDKKQLIFYDLGCGTGKAVMTAALLSESFKQAIGIEIMPALLTPANEEYRSYEVLKGRRRNSFTN